MNHLYYRIMGQKYAQRWMRSGNAILNCFDLCTSIMWVFMLNVCAMRSCVAFVRTSFTQIRHLLHENSTSRSTRVPRRDNRNRSKSSSLLHTYSLHNSSGIASNLARKQFYLLAFIASRISTQTIFIVELKQGRAHKIRQCDVHIFLTFCKLHNDDCWPLNTAPSGLNS